MRKADKEMLENLKEEKMSLTKFEEQDFKKPIPEEILDRVKENVNNPT